MVCSRAHPTIMVLGIISDIHGRFDALELAYNHLRPQCDQVVCLGDIVNGGGDAVACMDFVRESGIPTVRGNHDDAWLAMSTLSDFRTANFTFMKNLPTWLDYNGVVLVHDDPALATDHPDAFAGSQGYILNEEQARVAFETAEVFSDGPAIVTIGHTHVPAIMTTEGAVPLKIGEAVPLPKNASYILNPGAVGGQPRSRLGNTYGILDTTRRSFVVHQLNLPQLDNPWEGFFQRIVS